MLSVILLFARAAVVLAFSLVAVRLLRRSSASVRYLVLAAALAGVLALPLIERALPVWHTGALAADVAPPIEPALPVAEVGGQASEPAPVIARPPDITIPWTSIAGGIWLAVFGLALLRVGIGAARARAIARRGAPVNAGDKVADAWRALGGRGALPRVVASREIETPIVVGAIAPVVVVPCDSSAWSSERWRVVLLHELAHVRQRDGVVNLIAQLACCLYWIDPLVWIAARRLREERELAADDAVLRAGARASSYAEHLFAIATAAPHGAPASVLAMATPSRFESRMVALLDADRPRRAGLHRAIAVVAAVALVTIGVACVSPDQPAADVADPKPAPASASDPALQAFAEHELELAVPAHHATGAIVIVLDAKTGMPLAIASRGDADPRAARIPGSTIKPFTFAAALEAGTVDLGARIDCENGVRAYGTRTIRDASPNGTLDLGGILAVSSNVCTAKIAEPLGDRLGDSLRRYRIAAPSRIDTHSIEGASIASGEGLQVSAMDLAAAYTAFAGAGVYHAPDGSSTRVMREDTARSVLEMMERVVTDPKGTGHAARIDGVRVAGKTGTAGIHGTDTYYSSFVGIAPADAPRVVVLVGFAGVADPGGKVAAPVFATVARRALAR